MADEIVATTVSARLAIDPALVEKGVAAATAAIQKYSDNTTKAMEGWSRSIGRMMASAAGPSDVVGAKLEVISKKLKELGGEAALTDPQVQKLGRQIEMLAAAGGKVPAELEAVTKRLKDLRAAAATDKAVAPIISRLSGADAQRQMNDLATAITRMGGQGKVAEAQVAGLKAQVRALAAEGATVPPALKGMENGVSRAMLTLEAFSQRGLAGAAQQLSAFHPKLTAFVASAAPIGATLAAVAAPLAGVGAAIAGLGMKFATTGGQVADLSARLAMPAEAIQVLSFAADQAGIDFGAVTTAVEKLQAELGKSPEKFRSLGLSVDELMKLSPDKQFEAVAEAIRQIEHPTLQAQAAISIFGESGAKLLPLIRAGVAGLAEEAKRLGIVLGADQVAAADRLDDALAGLNKAWDSLLVRFGGVIAGSPKLVTLIERIGGAIGSISTEKLEKLLATLAAVYGLPGIGKIPGAIVDAQDSFLLPGRDDAAMEGRNANLLAAHRKKPPKGAAQVLQEAEANAAAEQWLKNQEKLDEALRESAKKAAEAFKNLQASMLGSDPQALKGIADLQKILANLTPAQAANSEVTKRIADAYEKFRSQVSHGALPAALEALRASLQPTITEFERFYESIGQSSSEKFRTSFLSNLEGFSEGFLSSIGFDAGAVALAEESLGQVLAAGLQAPDRDRSGDAEAQVKLAETLIRKGKERGDTEEEIRAALARQGHEASTINAAYSNINKRTAEINKGSVTWSRTLQNIANQLTAMGQAGSTLGKILGGVGGIGSMLEEGGALRGLLGKDGKGFDLGGLFKGADGKKSLASVAQGMSGALAAGMAAFDIGKTIVAMFKKTEAQKAAADVGRDMGVKISKALAEKIGEDSKRLGDRVAASLKNLKGIIDEAGGIAGFGFDKATSKARDLFSMIQTGKLSVKEAGESFNAVFGDLAEHLEKTKGLASEQFLELMRLDGQFGTQSQAVKDYVGRRVDALQGNLDTLLKGGVSTQAGATAIGASLAAAFHEGGYAAIEDLRPQIEAFEAQLAEMGLSGGAAFEELRRLAALTGDEVAGPLIEKFKAAVGAMTELHNMGLLNQETFAGFAAEAGAAYEKLREEGHAGADAMRLLQPDLQRIWELKRKNNYQVDEATAKLLAEAEAAGLVGEAHMSAEERSATAMERVADTLDKLAEKWGIVTQRVGEFSDAVGGIPNPGGGPPSWTPGGGGTWTPPPAPSYPGFASGGAADFGSESVALLHGREAVIPADRSSSIARDVAAQITALMDTGLGREIRGLRDDMRAQQQLLPRAIRDAILLGGA
jgi:hypothetical protein